MSGNEQILAAEYSKSSRAELDHARGAALHQFVHLENQLDIIFEFSVGAMELGGSNYRRVSVAQFAFSKIYNPDIKIQIIKKCLDTYLPDISPTFSKSMVKEFKTLAKMRNLIAHGAVQISVFDEIERHCLVTPRRGIDESSLFPENLSEFVKHAVFMFYVFAAIRDKLLDQELTCH